MTRTHIAAILALANLHQSSSSTGGIMNNQINSQSSNNGLSADVLKAIMRFLLMTIFMLAVLFLAAGRLDWWEAWSYAAMTLIILLVSRSYMIVNNPDMALERAEASQRENVKSWDKILVPLITVYGPLVSWIIAGLDHRFGWSPDLPASVQFFALAMISLGSLFGTWAMMVNRFFSSHVRIQTDRDHIVVSNGPYRIVRHPGYAGGILGWIAAPFFFSSYWVAVPAILVITATILRTAWEDRTLQEELPGYKAYARSVRYRLVPRIW
jgi:protein-S-isoprenylcysteine O-methyltransferase Ste14